MFSKILIANRGEIAVRIARTCQRLGVKTVVVYSDADADSLAVDMADEAVRLGSALARDSYLKIDAVVEAAKATGAEAVHPGFGFLSENPAFAAALAKAGIIFVGPNPEAIAAMGDKIRSKKLAQEAGVSIVPGHVGEIDDAKHAITIAKEIGYPVMIKASAGGGGKGMRIAHSDDEVDEGFTAAQNEARGAFGDDRIFVEKFIERPRHIEIQVLGDKHGDVIHLGERECSIQRRNQKVIEEAPSPYLTEETRAAMGAQAIALAKAVNYDSAGTVEFIADQHQNFYFLEMNTRLQVEHPVTEEITGLDLVEQMLRIAGGEALPLAQDQVTFTGWAMEARLYAEDPTRGFAPSIGRVKRWRPPSGNIAEADPAAEGARLRLDSGMREGDEVTPYYDPMLAKLIAIGPNRASATAGLRAAVERFEVAGPVTNLDFLAGLLAIPEFEEGALHTGFIAEHGLEGPQDGPLDPAVIELFTALAAFIEAFTVQRPRAEEPVAPQEADRREWVVLHAGEAAKVQLLLDAAGAIIAINDGEPTRLETEWRPGDTILEGRWGSEPFAVHMSRTNEGVMLSRRARSAHLIAASPERARLRQILPEREDAGGDLLVLSPMPGLVTRVAVAAGQSVKSGEALLTIEAMKMENIIRAERPGVIADVSVAAEDTVAADQVLITFEEPEAEPETADA